MGEWRDASIREAVLRELRRGGQIYFVHNEINTIEKVADDLRRIVPEATMRIGHGQMRERDLEQLMVDFYHRRFDLLLCTTIIESGIDVPTANTIMINHADRLGLAQLHQLRGRVGRSHHRAFAFLLVPSRKALTQDAAAAPRSHRIAGGTGRRIRAGNPRPGDPRRRRVPGRGAERRTDRGRALPCTWTCWIPRCGRCRQERIRRWTGRWRQPRRSTCTFPACCPQDYIGDVHTRLGLYKRIAGAPDLQALQDLQAEIGDRFGALPPAASSLLQIRPAHAALPRAGHSPARRRRHLELPAVRRGQHRWIPATIIALIQREPRVFRLEGSLKLRVGTRRAAGRPH